MKSNKQFRKEMERDLTGLKIDGLVFAHGSTEIAMRIGDFKLS